MFKNTCQREDKLPWLGKASGADNVGGSRRLVLVGNVGGPERSCRYVIHSG